MNEYEIKDSTHEMRILVGLIAKISHDHMAQRLSDRSLSRLQYGTLRVLDFEGSLTLSELSKKFIVDPSTLVPVVDALERKGLVIRERDPEDRRRFPVVLTDSGREIIRQVEVVMDDDPLSNGLMALGTDKMQTLLGLLRELLLTLPDGEHMLSVAQSRIYDRTHPHANLKGRTPDAGNCPSDT